MASGATGRGPERRGDGLAPHAPDLARVLLVDDDPSLCDSIALGLRGRFALRSANGAAEALALFEAERWDVVVTDLRMRGMDGVELCQRLVGLDPDVPVLVLTAFGNVDSAIAAVRAGAFDFAQKPIELDDLALRLERAVAHRALRGEVAALRAALAAAQHCGELVGAHGSMLRLFDLVARGAASDATVLVVGESGTGKELVARALHAAGPRAGGPFVAVNCTAVPEGLLESELFGHVRGAFTDTRAERRGLLLEADGGTLFLDEIGDMPLGLQPKLLRALQDRRVRPVGGSGEVAFDARIVAATHRDLESLVEERRFREDLYYRLNVIQIAVPPLRARGGDVLLLAERFLDNFARRAGRPVPRLSAAAAERLLAYGWPGNVRELENCIERAVALGRGPELGLDDLPEKIRAYRPHAVLLPAEDPSEIAPLEEVERRYILRALEAVGGNKSEAALRLGLDRKTLYRKLERYAALALATSATNTPKP
ncbi:MAG: sigma-54-dependent Fis family transcriptional regulator [Polyangiaceae bacterium]|nr:sigma-54-dependent Fis family transcriptional regulator [Polyangiaceae bacterium]